MADKKISALTGATTPLAGSEVLPIVQGGSTVKVSVDNLTAGKSVSATSFVPTGSTVPANGMYLDTTNSVSIANNSAQTATIRAGGIMGLGTTPQSWYQPGTLTSAQQIGANTAIISLFGNQSHFGSNVYLKTGTGVETYINTGVAMRYRQDAGSHVFESAVSGTAGNTITFTPLATISSGGNLTAHTGNVIIGTAGKGIDFSATASATGMTSELLADYEEGTWTPVFTSWAVAPTVAFSQYTKIGRTVCVSLICVGGTCTAGNTILGLPFTCGLGAASVLATASNNAIAFTGMVFDGRSKVDYLSAATFTTQYWALTITYFV